MSTQTIEKPDVKTDDGTGNDPDDVAHYVRKDQIAQSAIEGSHVVALCGEVFPVTKDTKGKPICQECKRIYDNILKKD
jgi:hypothetical protein